MTNSFSFNNLSKEKNLKIIVCPDSFKGTLSSIEVTNIISGTILKKHPNFEIVKLPIADGGEGTLDCFVEGGGAKTVATKVHDAYFELIDSEYAILPDDTAVIEAAKVIGLYMIDKHNPAKTSTYGIGEMIKQCANKKILIGLGGSSTNDGGAGIAAACGAKFFDENNNQFIPTGETLKDIDKIDISELVEADITCMCDVDNPLYGENGAAYVYAPQKGADKKMVQELDLGLRHYSEKIKEYLNVDVSNISGSGAAGGIGGGLVAFFGAKMRSGIDTILDAVHFDDKLDGAHLVITGEGKLDATSFSGKVIGGILKRTSQRNITTIAVCGMVEKNLDITSSHLSAVFPTSTEQRPFEKIKQTAKEDLQKTINQIIST